ncbi:iron complex transport system substrate-binding protein [Agrococcus baldri]|uniref:Iron complex transport system substrate-binding protein n=1 Tax=Agrococcus baldri TaxID=153730 RepID=A0AA94L092_9MICO|nr:ABC transporter substrate-binding protein [Agrococcus baldri]SFS15942.1 iron complex transport system substrate-binding protein [Agrococcus baldri]
MSRALRAAAAVAALALLTGCAASTAADEPAGETVTIATNLGPADVALLPERVAVLDSTAMETVRDMGITPVAAPLALIPERGFEAWHTDAAIADVGTHREPDFEALAAAEPDLIIGGYRFSDAQDELEGIAPTIDIAASEEHADGWIASLEAQTSALGQIFQAEDEAEDIIAALEQARGEANAAAPESTVFLGVVSGGQIDNGAQRVGRIIEGMSITDVFAGDEGDVHGDSGLSAETIAQANPEWAIILDRDAGTGETDAQPALAVIEGNEALANTAFVTEGRIIVLEADFYRLEGAQSYTRTFQQLAEAFAQS